MIDGGAVDRKYSRDLRQGLLRSIRQDSENLQKALNAARVSKVIEHGDIHYLTIKMVLHHSLAIEYMLKLLEADDTDPERI